ncbi:hypothetical protein [Enterocloster citroniae]|uniref:hypothetical protein n=1 Tax=Enterocloster citroniae TaxID=358743 RepID=UPI00349EB4C4
MNGDGIVFRPGRQVCGAAFRIRTGTGFIPRGHNAFACYSGERDAAAHLDHIFKRAAAAKYTVVVHFKRAIACEAHHRNIGEIAGKVCTPYHLAAGGDFQFKGLGRAGDSAFDGAGCAELARAAVFCVILIVGSDCGNDTRIIADIIPLDRHQDFRHIHAVSHRVALRQHG